MSTLSTNWNARYVTHMRHAAYSLGLLAETYEHVALFDVSLLKPQAEEADSST